MSRYRPVYLRHKHHSVPGPAMSRNLSVIVLRIGAILCWLGCIGLLMTGMLKLIESTRAGMGLWHWEPLAFVAVSVAALVVGWRVWSLKRWGCAVMVAVAWLWCLIEPWRPEHYPGAVVDVGMALATGVTACVMFAVPLTIAWVVGRSGVHSGF